MLTSTVNHLFETGYHNVSILREVQEDYKCNQSILSRHVTSQSPPEGHPPATQPPAPLQNLVRRP